MRDDETTRMPRPAGDEDGRATDELDLGATRVFPRPAEVGGAGADGEPTRAYPAAPGGSAGPRSSPAEAPTSRMPASDASRAIPPAAAAGSFAAPAPAAARQGAAPGYAPIANPALHVPAAVPPPAPRSPAPGVGARFGLALVGLLLACVVVAELVVGTSIASTALRRAMATFSAGDAWAAAGLSLVTWIVTGLTVLALAATARVSRAGAGVAAVVLLLVGLLASLWMPALYFSPIDVRLPDALDDWSASEGVYIVPPVLMVLSFALFGVCAAVGGARRRAWERGAGIR